MDSTLRRHDIDAYRLKFSGRGGEYFRVWIVNVLMSILTLGLYTPWARRRTARYFYDHTIVAGSPLEFTAPLRKMVFGFIIFAMLYAAFEIATRTGQDTAVSILILGAAALAPYIWGSAMRFRLASTRWRGLQLNFAASWREVYLASWPIFAMAAIWVGVVYAVHTLDAATATPSSGAPARAPKFDLDVTAQGWGLFGLGLLLSVLCIIRTEFNYKSLLVLRGGIGNQRGRWKPVYGDFVRIWLATVGVMLAGAALVAAIVFGLAFTADAMGQAVQGRGPLFVLAVLVGVLLVFVALLAASTPARAYREARMFQLIWSNVGLSQIARFKCGLRPWAYVRLRLKNMLLTVLTLGLYRPFARVNEYRMKVDSVTLHVKGGLDQLVGQLAKQQEGLGDMLADVAGLDIVS